MPLRRSLLTALCLAIFGSVPAANAQEKDPFAEWDRLHVPTPAKSKSAAGQGRVAAKSLQPASDKTLAEKSVEKSSVTYFSSAASESADLVETKVSPAIPLREKTQTRREMELVRAKAPASDSARPHVPDSLENAVTAKSNDVPSNRTAKTQLSKAMTEQRHSGGVQNAAFSADLEASGSKTIRSVASSSEAAEDANPFEEFLDSADHAPKNETPGSNFDNTQEVESAEPLFNSRKAAEKNEAPTRTSTPGSSRSADSPEFTTGDATSAVTNSGPQSPGVTVQWINHGGFYVGQECSLELVVKNTSQTVVRSVMTEAVIPSNVEIVEARPAAADGAEMPTWTFGEMQPGQSRSVMLKVIPKTRGDVRLDAYVRLTGAASSQFSVQEPMIGVVVSGPKEIEVGQQVGYIVRVSNPGTGLANNVIIQAAIPEGLEHRSGSLLTIEIGTLNPGESRQARLSLTAVEGGEQQLAVRVIADGGLSDQTTTPIAVAEPQLALNLVGPKEPMAGRAEEYKLSVSNSGSVQSTNVRAKYVIPEGCTFVSADRGGKFVEIDNAVEWFVGTLQPNDASDFTVTLKATDAGQVVHKAGVMSERGQVTSCALASNVIGTAVLNMKITADHRQLRVGEEIHWEVKVQNTGTRAATNVGVSCELPAGFEFIDAEGPTKFIAENGVLIFRSIPAIDAESDTRIVIHGRCTREGSQSLRLRVASESITDVLIGEESASVSR